MYDGLVFYRNFLWIDYTLMLDQLTASIQSAIMIVLSAAIPVLYFTISEYWMKGQTIGKKVMRITYHPR